MQTDLGSPTGGGLPKFAQKTLLEHIENSGGLDRYRNQDGKKDQLIRPLLEKFPNLFGGVGDQRRKQARDVIKYWYNHFYKVGKYQELLLKYNISPFLESIPSSSRTLRSSTKTASTSNKK